MKILFVLYFMIVSGAAFSHPIVGIFGDIHGNEPGMAAAMSHMKTLGVTHIIGTGDFVSYQEVEYLKRLLAMMNQITGVSAKNTYLMPGNWEHEASISAHAANKALKAYGNLIHTKYDAHGVVEIEGIKIMVSHFPQHPIPRQYIPPNHFLRRFSGQAYVMDTIRRGIYPAHDVEFEIFAHNHIRAAYVDPVSKRLAINPGVIDSRTKDPREQQAFAVYNGTSKDVMFYGIETGGLIDKANTNDRTITEETLKGLHVCSQYGTANWY